MVMITTIRGNGRIRNGLVATIIVLAFAVLGVPTPASAQYGTISYQGMLKDGGALVNGNINLDVTYYYAGTGEAIVTESFTQVPVTNGLFNVALGSEIGNLAELLDPTKPIELGMRINNSMELTPRAQLHAVPFAMTSHSLDGIPASATPARGTIFPLPLDENNQILGSMLPPFDGITSIHVGEGLVGGGTTGLVEVGFDPGRIPGEYIRLGSISGLQMSSDFAGNGVSLDTLGALAVRIDTNQFMFDHQKLHLRADAALSGSSGVLTSLDVIGPTHLNTDGESPTTIGGALFVSGGIDVRNQPIANVGYPMREDDAVNVRYVNAQIAQVIQTTPLPQIGTVWISNESDKKQKSATVTLFDESITYSSVIILTVQGPTSSGLAPKPATATCYSVSFNNLQVGSVDVTIARTDGDLDAGEGGTVHYVVYNNLVQPND
jgi:hypothetical protein